MNRARRPLSWQLWRVEFSRIPAAPPAAAAWRRKSRVPCEPNQYQGRSTKVPINFRPARPQYPGMHDADWTSSDLWPPHVRPSASLGRHRWFFCVIRSRNRDVSQIHTAANSDHRRLMPAGNRWHLDWLQRLPCQLDPGHGVRPGQSAGAGRCLADPAAPRREIRRRNPLRVHRGAGSGAGHGDDLRGRQAEPSGFGWAADWPGRGELDSAQRAEKLSGLQRHLLVLGAGRNRRPGFPIHWWPER